LRAKLFGGADVLNGGSPATSVGAANVRFALGFLHDHGIPLAGRRTGGRSGVTLRFDTATGEVLVRRLTAARAPD
jgi:chemotaxis protein CheD